MVICCTAITGQKSKGRICPTAFSPRTGASRPIRRMPRETGHFPRTRCPRSTPPSVWGISGRAVWMCATKNGGVAADLRYGVIAFIRGKAAERSACCLWKRKDVDTLEIDLRDEVSGLVVTLRYSVFAQWDVIARSAEIFNRGTGVLILSGPFPAAWTSQFPQAGHSHFLRPPHGRAQFGADAAAAREISGRQHARGIQPALQSICDFVRFRRHGNGGKLLAFSLVYSGNFIAQAEVDQIDTLRFVMGIAPRISSWELKPVLASSAGSFVVFF